jgi:transposase-like protein
MPKIDLEEIMEERGVNVDHATLNRWVIRYAPTIAKCITVTINGSI